MSSSYYLKLELPWKKKAVLHIGTYYGDCDEGTFIFTQHYGSIDTLDDWYNFFKWARAIAVVENENGEDEQLSSFQEDILYCNKRMEYENG